MQGTSGQGNQNGQQKQGGLSWTQTPSNGSNSNTQGNQQNSAKPISQVQSPLMPKAAPATNINVPKNNNINAQSANKKMEQKPKGAGRTAFIFIGGVIVGLIIGWGWFSLGKDDGKVATTDTTTTTATNSQNTGVVAATGSKSTTGTAVAPSTGVSSGSSSGSLTVAPMQQAGTEVAVSNIAVSVPTWVVILDNVNGKPGNVLGAQMFFAGEKTGVINLLRATTAGKTYFAAEYIDNGDHQFSKQTDTAVNNIAGAQMLVEFTTR
ncbi:MAG: hypothetical protein V4436_01445 [Patescibacteria group bacterium]